MCDIKKNYDCATKFEKKLLHLSTKNSCCTTILHEKIKYILHSFCASARVPNLNINTYFDGCADRIVSAAPFDKLHNTSFFMFW